VFGTTSSVGGNWTLVTVARLSREDRAAWIASGKISPLAGVSAYAGPAAYAAYVAPREEHRSPVLSELERPTFHSPNFNQVSMLEVMKRRRRDALIYLKARPGDYAHTALLGLEQFLGPTTEWHPYDKQPGSPHFEHAALLGGYTEFYNRLLHRAFAPPVGLYSLLPLLLLPALARLRAARLNPGRHSRARAALLAFALAQIGYVAATSALFVIGESARYRYQIEPFIWLVVALAIRRGWRRMLRKRAVGF
jgi:hypothetical protein